MEVRRLPVILRPDASRVLIRPFSPSDGPSAQPGTASPRGLRIISRVLSLSEEEAQHHWEVVCADFGQRHPHIEAYFLERYRKVASWMPTDAKITEVRQLLIGSYFTQEYSIEAAALFNPSAVEAPDQSGVPEGALRFVLSLRAVGEGHISSICFRGGIITPDFQIELGEPARWVVEARRDVDESFDRSWFCRKAREIGVDGDMVDRISSVLTEKFTEAQLKDAVSHTCGLRRDSNCEAQGERLLLLAKSNFSVHFSPQQRYSERAIFPASPSQTNGIEDARFVKFTEDDGSVMYYATYTAYDGRVIFPQLVETEDFLHFHFRTLQGAAVQNKGMALFPRRINGRYVMLSRQDSENIRIMFSDDLYTWETSDILAKPTQPWEFIQMGNCGSPIETEKGWLVLTHGVGAMRKYCISALLLDKDDPTQVIGRLKDPLIRPAPEEREGYVPNVVYSCGGLIHRGQLFLPYATSDWFTSFALVPLDELLDALV
ncbi:MAG: glycosidase [Verrucomicrobiaceae bacterium]|nr:MAG: glycosidase [Verrucomicrobiaceae bacterium]